MQYDIYGNPIQGQQTAEALQNEVAVTKINAARSRARSLTAKYNRDPRSMSDDDVDETKELAEAFGYGVTTGESGDKADAGDIAQGLAVGAIDGALLGLLKNEWYTNRRNGDYAKAGRIAGLVGSIAVGGFMNPAALMKVGGKLTTVLGAGKASKVLQTAIKYGTTAGVTRGIKGGFGAAIAKGTGGAKGLAAAKQALYSKLGRKGYVGLMRGLQTSAKYAPLGIGAARIAGGIGQGYRDINPQNEEDLLMQAGQLPSMQQMPQR